MYRIDHMTCMETIFDHASLSTPAATQDLLIIMLARMIIMVMMMMMMMMMMTMMIMMIELGIDRLLQFFAALKGDFNVIIFAALPWPVPLQFGGAKLRTPGQKALDVNRLFLSHDVLEGLPLQGELDHGQGLWNDHVEQPPTKGIQAIDLEPSAHGDPNFPGQEAAGLLAKASEATCE